MDIPSLVLAGLIGGAAGAVGWLVSLLFPKRVRPAIVAVAIGLAIAGTGPIKSYIQQETMTPDRFERRMMVELQSSNEGIHRIMLLYKEHAPDLYRSIIEKASSAFKDGKGKDAIADIVRSEVATYTVSKIGGLSDEGIVSTTDLMARQLEQLGKEGKDSICMKMLRQEPVGAVQWSDEMVELEYELARGVVTDAGGSGEVADQKEAQQAVNASISELISLHGQEKVAAVFGALSEGGAAPEGTCAIFADYFKLLKKAAGPDAAKILRKIYSAGA